MNIRFKGTQRGVMFALLAALLFGLSTPFAKLLLERMPPLLVAGLFYAGSGLGLTALRMFVPAAGRGAPLRLKDAPWLGGAVLFGGVLGPVLLMWGLRVTSGSVASLLLNFEGISTAVIAWFIFRENFDRRIAFGMLLVTAGGVVLAWPRGEIPLPLGSVAIVSACLCWAIDNNLTQKVSGADPLQIASIKGTAAGVVSVAMALLLGEPMASVALVLVAMVVGFFGYGVSLCLFVLALRNLGTARTGAYFSVAPFIGAVASLVVLRETPTLSLACAALLMGCGVWLHLSERHSHQHRHERLVHSHKHVHDEHHQHVHETGQRPGEPHTHEHLHDVLVHGHMHYPDIHHRHRHG